MTEKMWTECPECGSDNWLCDDDWEYDSEYNSREVECLECGCCWEWVYEFLENRITVNGGRDNDDLFGEDTTSGSPLDLIEESEDE